MSDEDLRAFLDYYLGVRLPTDIPRTVLLSKLNGAATVARDC